MGPGLTEKTRVLMLIDNFDQGGAQNLVLDLVSSLDAESFCPIVCSLRPLNDYTEAFEQRGIRFYDLGHLKYDPLKLFKLAVLIKRERIDVLHTFLSGSRVIGVLAARLVGLKAVFSHDVTGEGFYRNYPRAAQRFVAMFDRILMRWTTRLFVGSKAILTFCLEEKKLPQDRVSLLYNWIDPAPFKDIAKFRTQLREEQNIPSGSVVVGSCGRLHAMKGFDTLLRAVPKVVAEVPQACFLLVGDGPERHNLDAQVLALKMTEHVRLPGYVKDITSVYAAFDGFVLSSNFDTFPLAILEAMVAGVPVVATQVGGVPEMIQHEVTGLLVPAGDSVALADAVIRLLQDTALQQKLVANARNYFYDNFDKSKAIDFLVKFYEHPQTQG